MTRWPPNGASSAPGRSWSSAASVPFLTLLLLLGLSSASFFYFYNGSLIVLLLLILAIAIALGVVEIIELVYLNRSAKLYE